MMIETPLDLLPGQTRLVFVAHDVDLFHHMMVSEQSELMRTGL